MSNALNNAGWIGPLPAAWDVVPLKHRTEYVSRGRSPDYSDTDDGVPVVNQACIYWDGLRLANMKRHRRETSGGFRGRLLKHDVLINSTGTGTLGRAVVFSEDGEYLADSHVTIVRASFDLEPRYLRYLIETDIYQGFIYSVLAPGATNQIELSRQGLRAMPIPAPRVEQQRSIADFLDRKTAAIDELIAKKKRLAALLQEKRQAVITQAVTKGLDPNVKMKESGVEWIGRVPEHWELRPLRRHLSGIEQGWSPSCENRPADGDEWGVVKVGCVNYGRFDPTENKALPASLEPVPSLEIRPGDVLMSRANTRELVGSAAHVTDTPQRLLLCDKLFRLRYIATLTNPAFLAFLLQARPAREQIERDATGASGSMQNIGQDTVRGLLFAWPSMREQRDIVQFVQQSLAQLDSLREHVDHSVTKLREYRQSLITAAVTGKLDVTADERTVDDRLTALEASG